MTTPHEDAVVEKVRAAIAGQVAFDALERAIGQKALVNTSAGYPLVNLRRVNLVTDPEHPDEKLSLAAARDVIYWARPTTGDDPHIVGIQVKQDGSRAIFFGIVTPP
jgi:hypothetical protein